MRQSIGGAPPPKQEEGMSYLRDLIARRNHLDGLQGSELDPRTKAVRAALIAAINRGIAEYDANKEADRVPSSE
jgi:hypothetical protein